MQLSWSFMEADGDGTNGSPIDHYELEVWDTANRRWSRIGGNLTGPDLRYTHRPLTAGTTYVYRIRAVNGAPGQQRPRSVVDDKKRCYPQLARTGSLQFLTEK